MANEEHSNLRKPASNPAWIGFLGAPFTIVLPDSDEKFEVSLEEINSNSYNNEKLSGVVAALSLGNSDNLFALVCFDGAIAIPRNENIPSQDAALENLNRIFCALLLGGIHVEAIDLRGLAVGSLMNGNSIFIYTPTFHGRLRHKWAGPTETIELHHPRVLRVGEVQAAYLHGVKVLDAISSISPTFLLRGYTALLYRNRSDALSNFWIVVEQITSFLWDNYFLKAPELHPANLKSRLESLKGDHRTWSTAVQHELLWQVGKLSEGCFTAISPARKARNDLVHSGKVPSFTTIQNLYFGMLELIEIASNISPLRMRQLHTHTSTPLDLGYPEIVEFDDWKAISERGQS